MKKRNENKASSTISMYIKLILLKVVQACRVMAMLALVAVIGHTFGVSVLAYQETQTLPQVYQYITAGCSIIGIIVLNTVKSAITSKLEAIQSEIQYRQTLEKKKADHRLRLADSVAEDTVVKEIEEKQKGTPVSEEDRAPVRVFDVQEIRKKDVRILDRMIGMEAVKKQVAEFRAIIAYEKKTGNQSNHGPYHFRFTGGPGTGKTTVAKAMAAVLYTEGLVKEPKYIEVNANSLMGQYMGYTPLVVKDLFKQGAGGVIFIDEAYSLVNCACNGDNSGYGMEAVTTLLSLLESNESGTTVIFAGYEAEMRELFATNDGLASRVPNWIRFPDYTPEELAQMLVMNLRELHHEIDEDAKQALTQFFESKQIVCRSHNQPFGNGRFIRNVSKKLHAQHSMNYAQDPSIGTAISVNDIIWDDMICIC